jgi:hypothetical protein
MDGDREVKNFFEARMREDILKTEFLVVKEGSIEMLKFV